MVLISRRMFILNPICNEYVHMEYRTDAWLDTRQGNTNYFAVGAYFEFTLLGCLSEKINLKKME